MTMILVICGFCLAGCLIPILNGLIPDFNREREASRRAVNLSRSAAEWKRLKKGTATLYISEKLLPRLNKFNFLNLDRLTGQNMRQIVKTLGRYDSLEEMIATKAVYAALYTLPIAILAFVTNMLHFLIPFVFIVFLIKGIRDVRSSFGRMQKEITKDLPKLIEKMMMALETGKSFITVFRELERTSGPKMKQLLNRLNSNLQDMDHAAAIEIFARETTIPVMLQFSAAVKIGINSGYEEAKDHFDDIKDELVQLRKTALVEITRSRPDRVKLLQLGLIMCSIGSVIIVFVGLFSDIGSVF